MWILGQLKLALILALSAIHRPSEDSWGPLSVIRGFRVHRVLHKTGRELCVMLYDEKSVSNGRRVESRMYVLPDIGRPAMAASEVSMENG